LLVVFGHNWISARGVSFLPIILDGFRVPVFFFVSGLFFSTQNVWSTLKRRTAAYLKPYLVFCLGAFLVMSIAKGFHPRLAFGFMYGTGRSIDWPLSPIWFLPHLWLVCCFAILLVSFVNLDTISSWMKSGIVCVLIVLGGMLIPFFQPNTQPGFAQYLPFIGLPFSLDLVPINLAYFLLGSFSRKFVVSMKVHALISFGVFCLWLFVQWNFQQRLDLNQREYGNLFIMPLKSILGICMILSMSAQLAKVELFSEYMSRIGKSALFLLLFHSPLQHFSFQLLSAWGGNLILSGVLSFLVAVTGSILVHDIAKRYSLGRKLFFVQ